jgi:RNA-directed DNA polymerase
VDVSEMQRKLSQWATDDPTKRFVDLYSLLCNEVWLRAAHHAVNTNQGRETAGIDGKTMSNFNVDVEGNLKRLSEKLKAKTFEPEPVRRVYIPKANGKKRPLGIPMACAYCISLPSGLGIIIVGGRTPGPDRSRLDCSP